MVGMKTLRICGLCDIFTALASGRDSRDPIQSRVVESSRGLGFSQLDLRRAFATQGLPAPAGEQWDLMWRRFAAPNAGSATRWQTRGSDKGWRCHAM